jgi:lipooligosaccharide transport system ATP-binding protein
MKTDAPAREASKDTPKSDTPMIVARDLVKRFGDLDAVRGVSFQVERGRCIGLLGPNGAGKTTIMRMIVGQSTVTAGELHVFGEPPYRLSRETKARIGLVPQADNLDPDVSVSENLEIYGRYFGLSEDMIAARVPDLLGFMRLEEKADARVSQLSGGMKRRLVIARALIAEPEVVILDEPTTGLDPQARVMIWKQLLDLKARGKTMLLTTHYMDEAQRLCDRIIIIDHGEILDEGTPDELISRHVKGHVYEIDKPVPEPLRNGRWDSEDIGDSLLIYVQEQEDIRPALTPDTSYYHRPANLEDVFLRLTGRQLRET